MKKLAACSVLILAVLVAAPVMAQHTGGGGDDGGGGAGCGDVFGDLIHILRDTTGQPILAQRFIEMPKELPGYGWGYCPIAVDEFGNELAFAPLSCDVAAADLERTVEVDYFGRLSGGRTKERNSRMHFNEVISNIKMAETQSVGLEETGRLRLGYKCTSPGSAECSEWAVIDSPMENLALYTRLMKYGHFQTDPLEVDAWAHGDPALGTQYHPALDPAVDWPKFHLSVRHLLPETATTYASEELQPEDFVTAGAALGGAANKTGKITVDLVQYMNRILKITRNTEASLSTATTLPARVRDCWSSDSDPVLAVDPLTGEVIPQDPPYDAVCTTDAAVSSLPNYAAFPDAQELFVDFAAASYIRPDNRVTVIGPVPDTVPQAWLEVSNVAVISWLALSNGLTVAPSGLGAFIAASSDALRAVEFVHNYAIPEDLGVDFVPDFYKVTVKDKSK